MHVGCGCGRQMTSSSSTSMRLIVEEKFISGWGHPQQCTHCLNLIWNPRWFFHTEQGATFSRLVHVKFQFQESTKCHVSEIYLYEDLRFAYVIRVFNLCCWVDIRGTLSLMPYLEHLQEFSKLALNLDFLARLKQTTLQQLPVSSKLFALRKMDPIMWKYTCVYR
jgi:hypothetical protein